ncbi:MAG: HK97 gp10 family phage protein [Paenisporosarcina sp.]
MKSGKPFKDLDKYGRQGVDALASATPRETGETAGAWSSETEHSGSHYAIYWSNTHKEGRAVIVLLLEYGHGTGTGGYVPPRPFINQTMKPLFDRIADEVWRQVTNA